jgi:tetratricopeptide (TPR) repeat protein
MHLERAAGAATLSCFLFGLPVPVEANRESTALCIRAARETYNLDRDQALATYRQAIAADPQDARAYRGLASALWLSITFRRGSMTVDDYMGRSGRPAGLPVPPPPEAAAAFNDALERALAIARLQVQANPMNPDAHYQLGAAVGLRASYIATVEHSTRRAFRAAREAYDEHEKVLALDAGRKDAGLIVGTYRYIVSTLALPLRWAAYVAGFGGDKARGIRLIEEAAAYGGDNQEDARFALILLYNREGRFDDALKILQQLRERYTRNRLVWLESGATSLRAGRPADAERFLNEGLTRFADDPRPRMFGEDALWYYKRGMARSALGRAADADQDFTKALSVEGRKWVHGRAHLERGRLALKAGRHPAARQHLETAVTLGEGDNDMASANEAKRLLKGARR